MKKFTLAMSMSLLMSSVAIANPTFTVDTDETGAARRVPIFSSSLKQTFENEFLMALNGAQVWTNETPLRAVYERAIAAHTPKKYTKFGLYEKAISENPVEGVETQGILLADADEWDTKLAEAYKDHKVALKAISAIISKTKISDLENEWNAKVAEVLSKPAADWDAELIEAYEGDEGAQAVQRLTKEGRFQLAKSQSQWDTYLAELRAREPVSVSVVDDTTIKFEPVKAVIQRALSEVGPYDKYQREAIYRALTTDVNTEPKPFMTVLRKDVFNEASYTFKTSLPEGTKSLLLGGEGLLAGKVQQALFGESIPDALSIPAVVEDIADKTTVSVNINPLANADFLVESYAKMLAGLEEESLTQITDATLSRLYKDGTTLAAMHRALKPGGFVEFRNLGDKNVMEGQMRTDGFEFSEETLGEDQTQVVKFVKPIPQPISFDFSNNTAASSAINFEHSKGISGHETWGRWTDGKNVELKMHRLLPKSFKIKLKASAYRENVGQGFEVRIGNQRQTITPSSGPTEMELEFETDGKQDTVHITVPHPTKPPSEASTRKLGLGLRSLEIQPK